MVFPPVSRGDVEEKAAHQQDSSLTQEQHGSVSPQQGFFMLAKLQASKSVCVRTQSGGMCCVCCSGSEVMTSKVWCLLAVLDY